MLLLFAASARLYSALLVLYPEAFRRRYSEEMRRDFSELLREGLEEGGAKELVRVWVGAFWDLVLTALKERGTTSAREVQGILVGGPQDSCEGRCKGDGGGGARRGGRELGKFLANADLRGFRPGVGGSKRGGAVGPGGERRDEKNASPKIEQLTQTMAHAIDSRSVAEETIQLLGLRMKPAELSDNLTVEQVENTSFIRVTYEDTDPTIATQIVNTVGEVSSDRISEA
jgi:hypothetical protein